MMAVTNDLVTDRRVLRHAATLREAGYTVTVVRRAANGEGMAESIALQPRHGRGWRFYAGYNLLLAKRLLHGKPDVVWANDTDTLAGCWLAAKLLHRPLVMDAHELFPEVPEIQGKPLVKWVWRTLERLLMPGCDARLTVCQSIADHYRHGLGLQMEVVRNLPSRSEVGGRRSEVMHTTSNLTPPTSDLQPPTSNLRLLLYQGCVNLGRGVDWAIDALEWLDDCRLVVAGGGDLLEPMKAYAAAKVWHDRVVFTGRLAPDRLEALTAQADVGLVMLEDLGLSYHYALPNRIGDFVHAGVPMVVSDLPEMSAVVRRFGVGEVMAEPGPRALADSVRRVLDKGRAAYSFAAAQADMDWNKEKQTLLQTIERLCCTTST